jgi:hypothetical protein
MDTLIDTVVVGGGQAGPDPKRILSISPFLFQLHSPKCTK